MIATKKNNFRERSMRRGLLLIPNLLTTANLFCGFFSIVKAISGQYEFAAYLVVLAGLFDFLDGRVARLMNVSSDFGMEYDSLSDLTTFCMAPAVLAYCFGLNQFGKMGIGACFLYFACGALRLARFNVQSGSVEKVNFQGAPTPTGGGMLVSYVLFHLEMMGMPGDRTLGVYILLGLTVFMGFLMVSSVQYRSFKKVKRGSFLFLVLSVATAFIIMAQPAIMLFVFGCVYVSVGLIGWLWKSPGKIRGVKDLMIRLYNERNEDLIFEEEDSGVTHLHEVENVDSDISANKSDALKMNDTQGS